MKVQKPIIHGRDHLMSGADPVLPGFPSGDTMDEKILALLPAGFWKLNESTGSVAADSSGFGQDLSTTTPAVDPLWGAPAGPPGEQAADFQTGTAGAGGTASRVARPWPVLSGSFTAGIWVNRNDTETTLVFGQGDPAHSSGRGWQLQLTSTSTSPPEMANRPLASMMKTSGTAELLPAINPLGPGAWAFLALVYDSTLHQFKLYVNGLLQGTSPTIAYLPVATTEPLWIGNDAGGLTSGGAVLLGRFIGSYAFLVNRAMSGTELETIAGADPAGTVPDSTGLVLAIDENGNPAWVPPGVEVEHGAGTPDENPVTTPGAAYSGFPANASGWHYAAHTETAVLYDSAPGRFDVPSLKWVRTPFDTVRIQRRWELTVGGQFRDAWLPDDRGLTEHAREGLLHITADMVSDTVKHIIDGYFAIEYPVLDYQGLPDYTGGGVIAPDEYVRAARILNASTGVVLRRLPGSTQRRFMQWEWFNDADGMAVSVLYTVDNPYPIYPVWPARPLTLPQPYPQLSPTDSLAYYKTPAGNPGFNDGTFALEQNLVAGDNLCLQAWQDSPWLLRFSTDHFPNYTPPPTVEVWRKRPFLSVTYTYDPDSVDHSTGRLL